MKHCGNRFPLSYNICHDPPGKMGGKDVFGLKNIFTYFFFSLKKGDIAESNPQQFARI